VADLTLPMLDVGFAGAVSSVRRTGGDTRASVIGVIEGEGEGLSRRFLEKIVGTRGTATGTGRVRECSVMMWEAVLSAEKLDCEGETEARVATRSSETGLS